MQGIGRVRAAWSLALSVWVAGCGAAGGSSDTDQAYWADQGDPFVFGWLRASEVEPLDRTPAAAEVCPEQAARADCRMRVRTTVPCSGACWSPEDLAARTAWICICDLCAGDGDCTEGPGGTCVLLPGDTCDEDRRLCLYAGETCHDAASCSDGLARCMHRNGRAVCAEPAAPPP